MPDPVLARRRVDDQEAAVVRPGGPARDDLVHLGREKEKKFAIVREQENELFHLRGEYLLKKHLASAMPEEDRTIGAGELDALAQRSTECGVLCHPALG